MTKTENQLNAAEKNATVKRRLERVGVDFSHMGDDRGVVNQLITDDSMKIGVAVHEALKTDLEIVDGFRVEQLVDKEWIEVSPLFEAAKDAKAIAEGFLHSNPNVVFRVIRSGAKRAVFVVRNYKS